MRGIAFPKDDSKTMLVGPAVIDGKLWRMVIWQNLSIDGRSYLRLVFEEPDEAEKQLFEGQL